MNRLSNLLHPVYIFSLGLLLLNDFMLKDMYGNWFTGKLSDFAGLFAFTWFFCTIFPKSVKSICWIVAAGFIWWKSSFSNNFILQLNDLGLPVSRVLDFSDLMGLSVLPIVSLLFGHYPTKPQFSSPLVYALLSCISLFAFSATSMPYKVLQSPPKADIFYGYDIKVKVPKDSVMARLYRSALPIRKVMDYENNLNYSAAARFPGHRTMYVKYDSLLVIDSLRIQMPYYTIPYPTDSLDFRQDRGILRDIYFKVFPENEKRTIIQLVNGNFNHPIDLQDWRLMKDYSELHTELIEQQILTIVNDLD